MSRKPQFWAAVSDADHGANFNMAVAMRERKEDLGRC